MSLMRFVTGHGSWPLPKGAPEAGRASSANLPQHLLRVENVPDILGPKHRWPTVRAVLGFVLQPVFKLFLVVVRNEALLCGGKIESGFSQMNWNVARYILRELINVPWLEISEAHNGAEARAMLNEGLPDAMILDLLMPDVSGFEILRQLRAQKATEDLPILIYTSKPLTEAERAQLEGLRARIIRKEDISTRLSAKPFLDWLKISGLAPESSNREQNV